MQGKKMAEGKLVEKPNIIQWLRRIRLAHVAIFGTSSPLCKSLEAEIRQTSTSGMSSVQFVRKLADVETLVTQLKVLGDSNLSASFSLASRPPSTTNVFIIHGHDELNTRRLSQLLQDNFKLNPIAILAKPGMSRPLTDKFEEEAQTCSFAFALFTPDDDVKQGDGTYFQARPNVIYEAGWFIGRLGKARVILLLKSGTTIHSDLDGVSQIRFKDNIEDKFLEIQRELRAAKVIL
jgi:predicted nucleotide-binding protein